MRELVLYIACSLDGYIADNTGSVSFLDKYNDGSDVGFGEFLQSIDTMIMGGTTYRQIVETLSPDHWPYPNRKCYVYSHTQSGADADVEFTRLPPLVLLELIRREYSSDTWLVGGGSVVAEFLAYDLIDRMVIHQAPELLGRGVPLFPPGDYAANFEMVSVTRHTNGLAELTYTRKP